MASKPKRPIRIEIFEGRKGWHVRLRWPNGRILATSEAYSEERHAWRAALDAARYGLVLEREPKA